MPHHAIAEERQVFTLGAAMFWYMGYPGWVRGIAVTILFILVGILGYDIRANYVIWILLLVSASIVGCFSNKNLLARWHSQNWRLRTLVSLAFVVGMATLAALLIPNITDATQFRGAFYASWVSGVLFFIVIGVVATVITLSKPEDEPFHSRARILVHNRTGENIEYFVKNLSDKLEHYADSTDHTIIFQDIDEHSHLVRIEVHDTTGIKSYVDDVTTNYLAKIELSEVTLPPPNCLDSQKNRLLYCRVGGQSQRIFTFDDKIILDVPCSVAAGHPLCVEHGIATWTKKGESYEHTVSRFTKTMRVLFDNRLAIDRGLRVKFRGWKWEQHQEFVLDSGQSATYVFENLEPPRDLRSSDPKDRAYEFTVEVLTPRV